MTRKSNRTIPWECVLDWETVDSGHEASDAESSTCFSLSTEHTIVYGDHPKTLGAVQKLSNHDLTSNEILRKNWRIRTALEL